MRLRLFLAVALGIVLATVAVHIALAQTKINRGKGVLPTALVDNPTFASPLIALDHNSAVANSYGINIFNRPDNAAAPTAGAGANSAFVIHNYSDLAPAMQIDSTRSKPFITFKNASNAVNSAGTQGTSPYFDFWGYTTGSPSTNLLIGEVNQFLAFISYDVSRPWTFQSSTTGPSVQVNQPNAGVGLNMSQTGAGNAIAISHGGAAHGVAVTSQVGADGFFPLLINGRTNGIGITTSQNGTGQNVAQFTKNGTGAGDVAVVVNKGTDKTIRMQNATGDTSSFGPNGELIIGAGGTSISKSIRATASWTPGSIAAGTMASTSITVTGAVTGADCIAGVLSPAPLTGYAVQCIVTAANTCGIAIVNQNPAAATPFGTATFYCRVFNP